MANTKNAGRPPSPGFPGIRQPSSDFQAAANRLQTKALYYDVDLSTARSLAAGTGLVLPLTGNAMFADQKASSGYATVYFQDDASKGNTPVTMFPGAVVKVPFTFVVIENVAQAGLTLRLIYGVDIDFQQAVGAGVFGEVSVVEGGKARTVAGVAFTGAAGLGALAANYSMAQLYNSAAAGGKRLIVNKMLISTDVANSNIAVLRYATPLVTLQGFGSSKFLGGTASIIGQLRAEQTPGAVPGVGMQSSFLQSYQPLSVPLVEPIIVPPGFSLLVTGSVNAGLNCTFDWWEEAP